MILIGHGTHTGQASAILAQDTSVSTASERAFAFSSQGLKGRQQPYVSFPCVWQVNSVWQRKAVSFLFFFTTTLSGNFGHFHLPSPWIFFLRQKTISNDTDMRSLVGKHYVRLTWYYSPALAEGDCPISFAFFGSNTQTVTPEEFQDCTAGAQTLGCPVLLLLSANHDPSSGCVSQDLQHKVHRAHPEWQGISQSLWYTPDCSCCSVLGNFPTWLVYWVCLESRVAGMQKYCGHTISFPIMVLKEFKVLYYNQAIWPLVFSSVFPYRHCFFCYPKCCVHCAKLLHPALLMVPGMADSILLHPPVCVHELASPLCFTFNRNLSLCN